VGHDTPWINSLEKSQIGLNRFRPVGPIQVLIILKKGSILYQAFDSAMHASGSSLGGGNMKCIEKL
jgi:hypothetical protein